VRTAVEAQADSCWDGSLYLFWDLAAYANSAFETHGWLEMTPETKRRMAPAVVARRFLAGVIQVS